MAIESEEILSKISDLINSKVDELSTNLNNFRQEASNNNQTLENAIGSIKSVIDEKLSKIDQISSEINSIQTSVQNVADNVSVTNNKIDNILSQQTQLQRTVDSVSQNIEKLSTVTSNQLTYLSNQSQNITEKVDKLSLQQEREARTAAVEGARGTVVVDPATGKTVSGVAAADATGAGEETKQSLIGSVLSGIKGILTSPLALGAALGAALPAAKATGLLGESPRTPQAGSDAEFNLPRDTSRDRRTGGQTGQDKSGDRRTDTQESYTGSLDNINKAQLAFIRGLGMTETHFRNKEAYSERYNKPSNNANVRKYGQAGADYGYYQTNELDVKDAIRRGVPKEIARHLHGGGKGGKSTIEEQTLAMHEYLKKLYPKEYNRLEKDPSPEAFEALRQRARRKWFGLKDRPHVARKEFRKFNQDVSSIFPEIQPKQETETAPQPDARREPSQEQPRQFPSQRKLSGVNEEVTSRFNELQQFVGPLKVISGYRSPSYNRRVGGAKKSQHTRGNAIDIDVRHLSIEQRQELIKYASALGYRGIGVYANSIHLDMGSRRYWGPNYSGNSLPGWARRVIRSHMSNRFNRGDLPEQQRERQRQPDAKKQPDPDVSQPGTDKASVTTGDILRSLIPEAKASQNESVFRDEEDQFMRTYYPSDADPTQYQGMDDEDYEPDGPDLTGVPDFLKGFYKATGMPEGKDIEGRIEEKPRLSFNYKDDLFSRIFGLGETSEDKFEKAALKYFGPKSLNIMDDADLTPPKTKDEMNKILDDILKRARKEEAKKQAQQAPSQSQPVAGTLAGQRFFNDISPPPGENTPNNGVSSAPRPKHKIKLNQYIDPDTVIGEI